MNINQSGSNNPHWFGDRVGYSGVHKWIKQHKHKPQVCDNCHQPKPLDLANISQEYKRDIDDWEWLCRKCHMEKDGRLSNLLKYSGKSNPPKTHCRKGHLMEGDNVLNYPSGRRCRTCTKAWELQYALR